MLAACVRVMAAIGKDGTLCSGLAIDQRREEGKLIAAVNQERDEEKSALKIFHTDPSVNKQQTQSGKRSDSSIKLKTPGRRRNHCS